MQPLGFDFSDKRKHLGGNCVRRRDLHTSILPNVAESYQMLPYIAKNLLSKRSCLLLIPRMERSMNLAELGVGDTRVDLSCRNIFASLIIQPT